MTNKEFLEDRRQALKESIAYFSASNKPERERWVANEFLSNFNINFSEDIITSSSDPPDVVFRECLFEIKEILESGRKRHDEYKSKYQKSLHAKHPRDLLEEYSPKYLTPAKIGDLVLENLAKYERHYSHNTRENLDLLFYVNFTDHLHKPGPIPDSGLFESSGWRSVSAIAGWTSLVLFARETAPEFLRQRVGTVYYRNFE